MQWNKLRVKNKIDYTPIMEQIPRMENDHGVFKTEPLLVYTKDGDCHVVRLAGCNIDDKMVPYKLFGIEYKTPMWRGVDDGRFIPVSKVTHWAPIIKPEE